MFTNLVACSLERRCCPTIQRWNRASCGKYFAHKTVLVPWDHTTWWSWSSFRHQWLWGRFVFDPRTRSTTWYVCVGFVQLLQDVPLLVRAERAGAAVYQSWPTVWQSYGGCEFLLSRERGSSLRSEETVRRQFVRIPTEVRK